MPISAGATEEPPKTARGKPGKPKTPKDKPVTEGKPPIPKKPRTPKLPKTEKPSETPAPSVKSENPPNTPKSSVPKKGKPRPKKSAEKLVKKKEENPDAPKRKPRARTIPSRPRLVSKNALVRLIKQIHTQLINETEFYPETNVRIDRKAFLSILTYAEKLAMEYGRKTRMVTARRGKITSQPQDFLLAVNLEHPSITAS